MRADLTPARLRLPDIARLGGTGLRTRPLRTALAALGIAIGVAAMVAIVGISSSGAAEVTQRIDDLGPNLLRITGAITPGGKSVPLPTTAEPAVARIGPVISAAQTAVLGVYVYRNDHIPSGETGSITVAAADQSLLSTLHATVAFGTWFTPPTATFPTVVLGAAAAQHLGVDRLGTDVWVGTELATVVGVLNPVTLEPDIDTTAFVGWPTAQRYWNFSGHPSTVYARVDQSQFDAVDALVARSISPASPNDVEVTVPSDAIAAREATTSALNGLLIGLVGVALIIGGIGIANTMIVSVLERRPEIGLRRSLGATRGQIRSQFVGEAFLLSIIGGIVGTVCGTLVTAVYATTKGWPVDVPLWVTAGGLGVTAAIGAVSGLYPAVRASRISPTTALATT
jgi:putative ABC transport system permease protein